MKKALIISTLLIGLTGVTFGQKNKTPENGGDPEVRNSKNSQKSNKDSGATINAGTAIQGELQSTVDVRKSRVGDQVVLKTTKAIKQNGQTVVQKGSTLVGRITEITRRSKENSESRIGMLFDRIQGKDLSAPISASIVSVTNVAASAAAGDMFAGDLMGTSSTSGSVSRSGGNSSGGGLLGGTTGAVGGLVNNTTNTVGSVANTTTQTVGNTVGSTVNTASGTTQGLGGTLNGLRISQSTSASANGSTTLSSPNKDLRIEKGATFNLMVNSSVEK